MKFALALIATANAASLKQLETNGTDGVVVNGKYWFCDPPLPHTEAQLNIELDFFSRKFERAHYDNALTIYNELMAKG